MALRLCLVETTKSCMNVNVLPSRRDRVSNRLVPMWLTPPTVSVMGAALVPLCSVLRTVRMLLARLWRVLISSMMTLVLVVLF